MTDREFKDELERRMNEYAKWENERLQPGKGIAFSDQNKKEVELFGKALTTFEPVANWINLYVNMFHN